MFNVWHVSGMIVLIYLSFGVCFAYLDAMLTNGKIKYQRFVLYSLFWWAFIIHEMSQEKY